MKPEEARLKFAAAISALGGEDVTGNALLLSAQSGLSEVVQRVFVSGKRADESQIGIYNTKPILPNP